MYELDRALSRDQVLETLANVPRAMTAAVTGVAKDRLTAETSGGGWSALQVCGHMRDAALVYSIRFRWIVFDENPFLPNYDENNWVAASREGIDDLPAILAEVAASRADLVRVLSRLPEQSWLRQGTHEVMGAVALEPYVRHQLAHEEAHLRQLRGALRG